MIYFYSDNPNGFVTGRKFSVSNPCPTVMAAGMGGDSLGHWHFANDNTPPQKVKPESKPPYRVPLMAEIKKLKWNGFKVVSTFSGAGGSCTGYRMAGFKVVWANEFVPAAQDSYKANCAKDSILDCRDIKHVQPEEILAATGLKVGELDIFDGSPPCQAFSTAGKREKGWGKKKKYEHGASQCNETLFDQYVRLLRGLKPKVFIAENVSGLVKGTAKGYFLEILAALKASGYRVTCRVCDAQWMGVPQQRQRTIFIGVREDLKDAAGNPLMPVHPKPLPYRYSVRDALPWIDTLTHDTSGCFAVRHNDGSKPADCIPASSADANHFKVEVMVQSGAFPKKFSSSSSSSPAVMAGRTTEMRSEKPIPLPPSRLKPGAYGVTAVNPAKPCATITTGGPGNDHAVAHGTEKRKFTIAELKRICAFPDDFELKGSYAQQWERLGNSVPPVMMKMIAEVVRDEILSKAKP